MTKARFGVLGPVSVERARSIASIGMILFVFGVALIQEKLPLGLMQLDSVIVLAPVALLLALPLLRARGVRALPAQWGAPWAFVFVLTLLASAVVTMTGVGALLTIVRYVAYIVLMLAVAVLASDRGARRVLLWAITFAGLATTIWAVQQYIRDTKTASTVAFITGKQLRIEGTFGNANFYAEFLILVIAVTAALVFTERKWAGRLFAAAAAVVCTLVLLITYTRGSWLALAGATLFTVPIISVRYIAALMPLGVAGLMLVPEGLKRVISVFSTQGSAGFRLKLWRITGEAIATRPWFGIGPGEFLVAFKQMVVENPELNIGYMEYGAHNSFFTLAAEGGVLCGISFALFTFTVATRGLFLASREGIDRRDQIEILALTTGVVAFWLNTFTSNVFQHPQGAAFFWVIAGITLGCGRGLWDAPVRSRSVSPAIRWTMFAEARVTALFVSAGAAVGRLWRHSALFARTAHPATGPGALARSSLVRLLVGEGTATDAAEDS